MTDSGRSNPISRAASPMSFEPLTREHWEAVRRVYLEGIATGNATFQTSAPDWDEWDHAHLSSCRIVATHGRGIAGWAALSPVSRRSVYAGVAEDSVYVAETSRGAGLGMALLLRLIAESEAAGIWTLQAGIFPENVASIRLHTRAGFRVVGTRERVGCLNGRWRDVTLMERRSGVVGVD
jgi:L-amino acid N-acyltransferase YncA